MLFALLVVEVHYPDTAIPSGFLKAIIMLENIAFYQNNRERLKQMYGGRYLLIIEQKVLGDFCSWSEACLKGLGLLHHDTFLVKYCA